MSASLVGSEMCIRDSPRPRRIICLPRPTRPRLRRQPRRVAQGLPWMTPEGCRTQPGPSPATSSGSSSYGWSAPSLGSSLRVCPSTAGSASTSGATSSTAQNGPPLGSVATQALAQALAERKNQVSSVGPQNAAFEDSLAQLPGRTPAPAPGPYAALPGRGWALIVRQRYELYPGKGVAQRAIRGSDTLEVPVWRDPYLLQNAPFDARNITRAVDRPYVTGRHDYLFIRESITAASGPELAAPPPGRLRTP
eukprot:5867158-Alexandrium_andersonii.AAC.1